MNKVSVAFNISYSAPFDRAAYLPLLLELDGKLEKCYCQGFKRGYVPSNEPIEKMVTTKLPTRLRCAFFDRICNWRKLPSGTSYLWQCKLFDCIVASKLRNDKSDGILVRGNMTRTIKIAKKLGKKIILMADMSEPNRQYEEYIREKEEYDIVCGTSYGDISFRDMYLKSINAADYIITLTNVSNKTYIDGGYKKESLKVIQLTSSFFTYDISKNEGKKRAFICTANHSLLKGTHRLLNAWKKACINEIPLIIVGKIYDDVQEFIEKYGPFGNVIFEGYRGDLQTYYDEYDAVGILLSFSESAGRTTTEMMKKGFPMIVSREATCDLIEDGKNGFVINPRDENAIIEKLQWFASDWNRTSQMKDYVLKAVNSRALGEYGREMAQYLISL